MSLGWAVLALCSLVACTAPARQVPLELDGRPRKDISQDPRVLELSSTVEGILGCSGGPPIVYEFAGEQLESRTFMEGIALGGPYATFHVIHELVHWHMRLGWEALPHGAEEGLAVIIGTYVLNCFVAYGPYTPGDESVFEWTLERWLADATRETYDKSARSLLAIGIPQVFARYGVPVSPGIQRMVETYCVDAKRECLRSAPEPGTRLNPPDLFSPQ